MLRRKSIVIPIVLVLITTLACSLPILERFFGAEPSPTTEAEKALVTPGPSATPLPPIPPTLVESEPALGEELHPSGAITLFFDQPMDASSVEAAIHIEPSSVGDLTWEDESTLQFKPSQSLERATKYLLTVSEGAKSSAGLSLAKPIELSWTTAGYLEVSQVLPEAGTVEVDPSSSITVVFNRPVVPLQIEGEYPQPLSFEPTIRGEGEWVDTSIYLFRPSEPLPGGTQIIVRVEADLEDIGGGILAEAYQWSFNTSLPKIVDVDPAPNETDVLLNPELKVTFNQAMDPSSTEQAFSLETLNGVLVPGHFGWDEAGYELTFTPSMLLEYDQTYIISITDQAQNLSGIPLSNSLLSIFHSVQLPRVIATSPQQGGIKKTNNLLTISFSSPMDQASIVEAISITPEVENLDGYWKDGEKQWAIYGDFSPATSYLLSLDTSAQDLMGTALSEPLLLRFSTSDLSSLLDFVRYNEVITLTTARPPQVEIQVRNLGHLDLNLYRLSMEQFLSLLGTTSYRYPQPTPYGDLIRQWSQSVSIPKNETQIVKVPLQADPLPSGPYMLIASSPDDSNNSIVRLLMVRDTELVLKSTVEQALIWAVDLSDGQSISECAVRLYTMDGMELASGITNEEGISELAFPHQEDPYDSIYAITGSPGSPGFGFTASTWSTGIEAYEFGIWLNPVPKDAQLYLYTDRPIYRSGQTVRFRGMLRDIHDDLYQLPQETTISLDLIDPFGEIISTQLATISTYGTFQGQFALNEEATSGLYQISGEEGLIYFDVAAYRKPDFNVTLLPSAEDVATGDPLTVDVEAEYYFGGPVPEAEVSWNAYTTPYFPIGIPQPIDWYSQFSSSWIYFGYNPLAQGDGVTDAQGRFTIDLPTTLTGDSPVQINIDVNLSDASGLVVKEMAVVNLHPAAVYFSLIPERYALRAGEKAVLRVSALDWDGNLLGGQDVKIEVERVVWKQTVSAEGRIQYESQATPVNQGNLTTTEDGTALFSFEPAKAGTYSVRATGIDGNGRQATAQVSIWVSGEQTRIWRQPTAEQIVLVPDRDSYAPGDTARILVPSPFDDPVQALLTIERGGVISHRVLTIDASDSMVEIPIETLYAPNIFVSVVLLKPATPEESENIAVGLVDIEVSAESQELNVQLTHAPTVAEPGGTVQYDLKVTDAEGHPVQAEFSFALVDLSVLNLAELESTTPFEAFYSHRSLNVRTGASVNLKAEGLTQTPGPEGAGGGGGSAAIEVRSEFPDTAYWNPSIVTDSQGRAQVSIDLPDSLTTWRMDVRGVTQETMVGSATVDVISTKELLIRPITPRFFTAGDAASVAATVHNNGAQDLNVEVRLSASGAEISDSPTQLISLPAGSQSRVDWNLTVQDVDGVDLTFYVSGDGLSDASKPTIGSAVDGILPVLRYEAPDTAATAGELPEAGRLVEAVNLPRRYDATQGELRITLDPSLGAALDTALGVLEHSPYESTEQLISRFLPNLVTLVALQEFGIVEPSMEVRLERTLEESLQRLYARQNNDGGWGWWKDGYSDAYLTAYSLLALVEAQEAGVSIQEDAIASAVQYLQGAILSPDLAIAPEVLNRQSFLLYALAKAGEGDLHTTTQMATNRETLSIWARALITSTLAILDPDAGQITTLQSDLESSAIRSATGTHWQEESPDFWNLQSGVKTTAHVLQALLMVDPENAAIPGAVRWLLAARTEDGSWNSTHNTTWALLSLVDWLKVSGVLESDYDYSLRLNEKVLASGTTSHDALFSSIELITPVAELLATEPNQVAVERGAGSGNLYYTAHLTVYRPVQDVSSTSRGLDVHREYYAYDGTCGGLETPCPIAPSATVGDDLLVRITLVVPSDQYYVVIEDPFPAGIEPIEASLPQYSLDAFSLGYDSADDEHRPWGWWYFSHAELGDDRLRLFADFLPAGTYQYTYQLHALLSGEYHVLPTRAWAMYFPETYGQAAGRVYTIRP
jgi:uncharacterized protein YfaS (alpha-2-macroglobulin family)